MLDYGYAEGMLFYNKHEFSPPTLQPTALAYSFALSGSKNLFDQHLPKIEIFAEKILSNLPAYSRYRIGSKTQFLTEANKLENHQNILFSSLDNHQTNLVMQYFLQENMANNFYQNSKDINQSVHDMQLAAYQAEAEIKKESLPFITTSTIHLPNDLGFIENSQTMQSEVFDYLRKGVSETSVMPEELSQDVWEQLKEVFKVRKAGAFYPTAFFAHKNNGLATKKDKGFNFFKPEKVYTVYVAEPGRISALGKMGPKYVWPVLNMLDAAYIKPLQTPQQQRLEQLLLNFPEINPLHYKNGAEQFLAFEEDPEEFKNGQYIEIIPLKKSDNTDQPENNHISLNMEHPLRENDTIILRNGAHFLGLS